jgi:bacteriocin biosynthesis cyclodehydratase domain-containing protein
MTTNLHRTRLAAGSRAVASEDQLMIVGTDATTLLPTNALTTFMTELIASGGDLDLRSEEFANIDERQRHSLTEVRTLLLDAGFLEPIPSTPTAARPCVTSLFARGGGQVDKEEIDRRLRESTVSIVGDHVLPGFDSTMDEYGVTLRRVGRNFDAAAGSTLTLVTAHDEYDPILTQWNTHLISQEAEAVWLCAVPPTGNSFSVGPWFYSGRSACHTCYRMRRASTDHNSELRPLVAHGSSLPTGIDAFGTDPAFNQMQANLLADAIVRHIALDGVFGQAEPGHFATYEYTLAGLTVENHRILRVPRCPDCSRARGTGHPQVWFHQEAEHN